MAIRDRGVELHVRKCSGRGTGVSGSELEMMGRTMQSPRVAHPMHHPMHHSWHPESTSVGTVRSGS